MNVARISILCVSFALLSLSCGGETDMTTLRAKHNKSIELLKRDIETLNSRVCLQNLGKPTNSDVVADSLSSGHSSRNGQPKRRARCEVFYFYWDKEDVRTQLDETADAEGFNHAIASIKCHGKYGIFFPDDVSRGPFISDHLLPNWKTSPVYSPVDESLLFSFPAFALKLEYKGKDGVWSLVDITTYARTRALHIR